MSGPPTLLGPWFMSELCDSETSRPADAVLLSSRRLTHASNPTRFGVPVAPEYRVR
jgi:hypothetical protein